MPWTCPECKRPFKHKNQAHSCVTVAIDSHFDGKNIEVRKTFDALIKSIKPFGKFSISPALNAIMVTREGTFLAVKPKREWLDIEFLLNRKVEDFRIHKTVWANKSRCAHFLRLESPQEIDNQLIQWLNESYHASLPKQHHRNKGSSHVEMS